MKQQFAITLSNDIYPNMQKYYGFSDRDISFLCAIESLLMDTKLERINTRDLCKEAKRGKDALYSNYRSKDGLIDFLVSKICKFLASLWRVEDGRVFIDMDEEIIQFMLTWSELLPNFRKIVIWKMETDKSFYSEEEDLLKNSELSLRRKNKFIIARYGIKGAIDSWLYSSKRTDQGISESARFFANEIESLTDWINSD